jgi:hypothetical protein
VRETTNVRSRSSQEEEIGGSRLQRGAETSPQTLEQITTWQTRDRTGIVTCKALSKQRWRNWLRIRRFGQALVRRLTLWFDFIPIFQAEKTAPTNPMKDLKIEKLVISASYPFTRPSTLNHSVLTYHPQLPLQTSPSVNLETGLPELPRYWNNSPVNPPSPPRPDTPSDRSPFVVTKRSLVTLLSVDPRPRRFWSVL